MKPEHRAEVAERAARATPGPWIADIQEHGIGMHVSSTAPNAGRDFPELVFAGDEHGLVANWDDVRFAAAARTDVPALLADVDAAIARAEAAEGQLAAMQALVDAAAVEREARVKRLAEERDAAIARAEQAERQLVEAVDGVAHWNAEAGHQHGRAERAERERDDALTRKGALATIERTGALKQGELNRLLAAGVEKDPWARLREVDSDLANLRQELDLATFLAAARREALEAVREPFAATYPDSPVLAQVDAALGSEAGRQWAHLVVKRRETAELLELARCFIWRAFDEDGYEVHEQEGCPEDDTCTCVRMAEANRILRGWIAPQER